MSVYDHISKVRFTIVSKLKEAGAISVRTAVPPMEAELDLEEARRLQCLAGGTLSKIKKTEDGRYYI